MVYVIYDGEIPEEKFIFALGGVPKPLPAALLARGDAILGTLSAWNATMTWCRGALRRSRTLYICGCG